jgi:DNA-binding transcriptional MerR regulator
MIICTRAFAKTRCASSSHMGYLEMDKSIDAFRTISEVAEELNLPQHVLRFWETRFLQIRPLKRAGGRRYYRPRDIEALRAIKRLLYEQGYTIKGVQRVLKERGAGGLEQPNLPADRESLPFSDCETQADSSGTHGFDESRSSAGKGALEQRPGAHHDAKLTLTREDFARLEEALAELAECERILAAARRP